MGIREKRSSKNIEKRQENRHEIETNRQSKNSFKHFSRKEEINTNQPLHKATQANGKPSQFLIVTRFQVTDVSRKRKQ